MNDVSQISNRYGGVFLQQGFTNLGSLWASELVDQDLRDIGVRKMRHRKVMLRSLYKEGRYIGAADLSRLVKTIKTNRQTMEQLHCVKEGPLDMYLTDERQFRDCPWQRVFVTLWVAGGDARVTAYQNKEQYERLTGSSNICAQWADAGLFSISLVHGKALVVDSRKTPSGFQDFAVPIGAVTAEHREMIIEFSDAGPQRAQRFRMSSGESLVEWTVAINDAAARASAGH